MILEDTITLHGKLIRNIRPTRNWYICWDDIRRYHYIAWETNSQHYTNQKHTFIGMILEDIIGKLICNIIPTRNWYIYWDDIRRYHYITWEKMICMICIHLPETETFIGMRMLLSLHHKELSYIQGNPYYYPGIFYQLLCTY